MTEEKRGPEMNEMDDESQENKKVKDKETKVNGKNIPKLQWSNRTQGYLTTGKVLDEDGNGLTLTDHEAVDLL